MTIRAPQAMALLLFPLIAAGAYEAIAGLRSARVERGIARSAARETPLVAGDGVAIVASDRPAAARALNKLLGDRASTAGIRLSTGIAAGGEGHAVASDLVAEGNEAQLLKLAAAIETGRPTARLERWTLGPSANGLRLEGRAIALWQRPGQPAPADAAIAVPDPSRASTLPATDLFVPGGVPGLRNGFPAELIGIVGRIAVDPQAMLRLPDGGTRTMALNETVAGWTLAEIDADRVRFRKGGAERTLVLPVVADQ